MGSRQKCREKTGQAPPGTGDLIWHEIGDGDGGLGPEATGQADLGGKFWTSSRLNCCSNRQSAAPTVEDEETETGELIIDTILNSSFIPTHLGTYSLGNYTGTRFRRKSDAG